MSKRHEGGCVCGAIRYVTHGNPLRGRYATARGVSNKHGVRGGTSLRRRSGRDHRRAADEVQAFSDESGRWLDLEFCPRCGTNIGFTLEWRPGARLIDAGTFDDPGWIRADRHHFRNIFLRSAQKWSVVSDGVEKYEKHFAT